MYNQWRQIISLSDINVCKFFEFENPLIESVVGNARYHFPNLPWDCPIKKGQYGQTNVTILDANEWSIENDVLHAFLKTVPNGMYLLQFHFFSAEDPLIVLVSLHYELKKRMNYGNF